MKKILHFFIFLFTLSPFVSWAEEKTLRVGVAPGEPFVMVNQNEYKGIAIEAWKMIAKNLNLKYEFVPVSEHIDDDVRLVADGDLDILIGPIVPTKERIALVDFTRPYYLSQIGIVVSAKEVTFLQTLLVVLDSPLSWFMLFLLAVLIVYVHIFWYFERRQNYMNVPQTYWQGIASSFWINTLDIGFTAAPTHVATRSSRFVWYFVGLPLMASMLSAIITSSLTVSLAENYSQYNKLNDFSNRVITAVPGTVSYKIATEAGLHVVPSETRADAINRLLSGKVAGFVDYYSIADYYLHENQLATKLSFANFIMAQNTFSFAVPLNSSLRHKIDLELDILQDSGQIRLVCEKLLGEKFAKNCQI